MDLEPFFRINPCGYQGLQMTMLSTEAALAQGTDSGPEQLATVEPVLVKALLSRLGYNAARSVPADAVLGQPLSASAN